jgi:hypothetical protein
MSAIPEHKKQMGSPNNPVASPTNATGPNTKSQVILFEKIDSVEDHSS